MDQLSGISVFERVAERGSFTAAARDLGLSKSAVSKQVARLEERLGARLLHRTTRRLHLTEVGQAYFERAQRIVADAEEAELAVTRLHAEPRGTLKINAPMSFGIAHLAPALPEYMALYPEVKVDLTLNDRQLDLIEDGFDLGIRIGRLADSSLIARRLAPCRLTVVATSAYWDRHGRPAHPRDLAEHACMVYDNLAAPNDWTFQEDGSDLTVRVHGPLKSNNGEALLAAVLAGQGVVLQPTFMCGPALCGGDLEEVLADYTLGDIFVNAIWPGNRHLSAKVRTFVDFLAARFGPEPYWDVPGGKNGSEKIAF